MPKLNFDEMRANGYPDWTDEELAMGYYKKYMAQQGWTWEEFRAVSGLEDSGIGQQGDYPEQGEPGTGMSGFGYDNPEIAAEMSQKDWKPWLDEVGNAIHGKLASGATFGIAPAIARAATGGESDKQLQRGTDILGKNLSFLIEAGAGVPTSVAAAPLMLSRWLGLGTEKLAPGIIAGGKRVIGNAIDAGVIQTGNKVISEGPGAMADPKTYVDLWDTAKAAGTWGAGLETLLGIKRMGGTAWAQHGMNPDQKALDAAITAFQKAVAKYGPEGPVTGPGTAGMEVGADLLPHGRGAATVESLLPVASPAEAAKSREFHENRLAQAPYRFGSEVRRQAGEPPRDPKALAEGYREEGVYRPNEQYNPLFERNPTIKKETIWVDPVEKGGKKERAVVPAGMGKLLKDRKVYNMWSEAKARAETLTKSYTDTANKGAGRKPAGELEKAWHITIDLEKSGEDAVKNYGREFKRILRENHPELDTIVNTQSLGHSKAEAAEIGQRVAQGNPHLLDTEARALTDQDPARAAEIQNATRQGFWGELDRAAKKGDKLPRSSPQTRDTIERIAGPQKADEFNEFLRQQRNLVETDRSVSKSRDSAVEFEPKSPKGAIARLSSGVARMGIEAALGGIPGAIRSVPYLLSKVRVNPNALMSEAKANGILQQLRRNILLLDKAREPNWAEKGKYDTRIPLPAISTDARDEQQKERKARRKGAEASEKYLKGSD